MLIFAVACVLLGTILGRSFRVYVLFPTCLLLLTASMVIFLDGDASFWTAAACSALLIVCIEIGYVIGISSSALPRLRRLDSLRGTVAGAPAHARRVQVRVGLRPVATKVK